MTTSQLFSPAKKGVTSHLRSSQWRNDAGSSIALLEPVLEVSNDEQERYFHLSTRTYCKSTTSTQLPIRQEARFPDPRAPRPQLFVHLLLPQCCITPGKYEIRSLFTCKFSIGSEASRPCLMNYDPIAKPKKKGRDFTPTQQPVEKRRRLEYIQHSYKREWTICKAVNHGGPSEAFNALTEDGGDLSGKPASDYLASACLRCHCQQDKTLCGGHSAFRVFDDPARSAAGGHRLAQCSSTATAIPDYRMWESCWTMPLAGGFSWGTSVPLPPPIPLHSRAATPQGLISFHVLMSGDDAHLRIPAGKSRELGQRQAVTNVCIATSLKESPVVFRGSLEILRQVSLYYVNAASDNTAALYGECQPVGEATAPYQYCSIFLILINVVCLQIPHDCTLHIMSNRMRMLMVIEASMEQHWNERAKETGDTRENSPTRRPAASSSKIPTCENPGATRPGIEPGSHCTNANTTQKKTVAHTANSSRTQNDVTGQENVGTAYAKQRLLTRLPADRLARSEPRAHI
ncbi:hypothetical protein PR048_028886 [Dryococelus australis]|uniref:Uncharacterized protein n=1 Tax=Dryococelus australis TaxID=614101 RepID=A0ABQ9GEG1_9NEOP|nr:hypothetical protein PR048_028886 [Dryococelus australis]